MELTFDLPFPWSWSVTGDVVLDVKTELKGGERTVCVAACDSEAKLSKLRSA